MVDSRKQQQTKILYMIVCAAVPARHVQDFVVLAQADVLEKVSLASKWIHHDSGQGHGQECDTSCNLCLRDFGNQSYHGLLDWRLALDMARLATSSQSAPDLVSPFASFINPWKSLTEGSNAPVPLALQRLGYEQMPHLGNLNVFRHPIWRKVLIERHPLWQDDHPEWVHAKAESQKQYRSCPRPRWL